MEPDTGTISRRWDHDLYQNQELGAQQTEPSRRPHSDFWMEHLYLIIGVYVFTAILLIVF